MRKSQSSGVVAVLAVLALTGCGALRPGTAVEVGYFDRGPVYGEELVMGGFWSAYYYKGRIYGTEIARGLDVLALQPSPQLSQNEIQAAALAVHQDGRFNPQTQAPVSWPAASIFWDW